MFLVILCGHLQRTVSLLYVQSSKSGHIQNTIEKLNVVKQEVLNLNSFDQNLCQRKLEKNTSGFMKIT